MKETDIMGVDMDELLTTHAQTQVVIAVMYVNHTVCTVSVPQGDANPVLVVRE
jgi:hypothetical protein